MLDLPDAESQSAVEGEMEWGDLHAIRDGLRVLRTIVVERLRLRSGRTERDTPRQDVDQGAAAAG